MSVFSYFPLSLPSKTTVLPPVHPLETYIIVRILKRGESLWRFSKVWWFFTVTDMYWKGEHTEYLYGFIRLRFFSRWWFQIFLFWPRKLWKWSNLTWAYFSRGLVKNHQPVFACLVVFCLVWFQKKMDALTLRGRNPAWLRFWLEVRKTLWNYVMDHQLGLFCIDGFFFQKLEGWQEWCLLGFRQLA